jgi:predicted  nucleic acid-binding Zn-ribbon protein
MNPDLERLIALQRLDTRVQDAERRIAEEPQRQHELDARIEAARQQVETVRDRLAASQAARRAVEKDVALHAGRLSKFREQLMAVKTNVEYQAMQKEIAFAQTEVQTLEDKVLERMLEADELAAALKRAEADFSAARGEIDTERRALEHEIAALKSALTQAAAERATLVSALDPELLATFEKVSRRRNGVAVAEARDGVCTICHVRLRPQVFNTVRRNDQITQCESCSRILYFAPASAAAPPDDAARPAS